MKRFIIAIEFLGVIVVTILVALFVTNFLVRPAQIKGNSMYPTLKNEEMVITSIIATIIDEPKRFDIVVVRRSDKQEWVKRVIGLPNETIEVKNNVLYINDEKIDQQFLKDDVVTADFAKRKILPNEYFVMGDNRNHSTDSRFVSDPITKNQIVAKHIFVYFPFGNIRFMK